MYLKLFAGFLLMTSLVGCATTRSNGDLSASGELQTRITQLEDQLEQKDEEINDLKDEVQSLSDDVRRTGSSSSKRMAKSDSSSSDSAGKKEGTIRVNVNPDQVQLALKNAGYYTGTVDGRIGEKTKKAIAEFQKAHNLNADGVVGKKTWDELKTYLE